MRSPTSAVSELPPILPTSTLAFSEAQMQALMQQTQASVEVGRIGGSSLTALVGDRNTAPQSP
ncbi:hypothetical protein, partial [Xanthomonas arboricola]|uniref:hypothetical protein n=1 Tax=Xanthomonas arboricola TaxID=56448 RepID=UPI001C612A6F